MNKEIEVGEWIRTKKGYIDKIIIVEKEFDMYAGEKNPQYLDYSSEDIAKHSKNIIDLIEEGDYVNGYRVIDIMEDMRTGELHLEMTSDYTNQELGDCTIYNKDIKSIVAKEQYKSVEYRIKEEQ